VRTAWFMLAALSLLVTACSAASSPSASVTMAPPATAASAATANPDAGLLTGTQLKAALAPASWFPAGFTMGTTGAVNTGSHYQSPEPPGRLPCSRLEETSWIDLADVGFVSFAQNDYIDKASTEEYAQEIDVYQGTGARRVMTRLSNLPRTCPTFRDGIASGSTVTVARIAPPRLGYQAVALTLADPAWQGGETLEAIRIGTAVITVWFSADSGPGTAQATALARTVLRDLKQVL
jgi:hypothetical protein